MAGIMEALAGGLSEAAGGAAKIGFDMIQSQIDQDRQAALIQFQEESRNRTDSLTRDRNKEDAAQERGRVAKFAEPIMGQKDVATAQLAEGAGANDANAVGADENIGRDVQKASRTPTAREMQQRASEAGDLVSAGKFSIDADRREDNEQNAIDRKDMSEKWQKQFKQQADHYRAIEKQAAAQLGLKEKERKDLSSAMEGFIAASTNYELLPKGADEATKKAAKLAVDNARIAVSQFGIKLPGVEEGKQRYQLKNIGDFTEPKWVEHDTHTGATRPVEPTVKQTDRASQFKVLR